MTQRCEEDPKPMASRKIFEVLSHSSSLNGIANTAVTATARLGRLSLPGRQTIETPNYTALTSRGVIPHLTPDNCQKYTSFGASYVALEDFIEKKNPPIYGMPNHPDGRPRLHSFTGIPTDTVTIMAARRCPYVLTPLGNTAKAISIYTSQGFYNLDVPQYATAVRKLRPDIVVALASLPQKKTSSQGYKVVRMVQRTEEWLDMLLMLLRREERKDDDDDGQESVGSAVFAPVLPVDHWMQWNYLNNLAEELLDRIDGLAIYDVSQMPDLDRYPALAALPRLSLHAPETPAEVLRQIALGVDICAVPFLNKISDAGVALTFTFPPPPPASSSSGAATSTVLPLGVNMWDPSHNMSLDPLLEGCTCYVCTRHHRAFVYHLLTAKEMLGWNLLQIHNHHVMSEFFKGVREALQQGTAVFEDGHQRFLASYEAELPEGTGERPRARGYHFKSEAHQEKINKPSWAKLDGEEEEVPVTAADGSPNLGTQSPASG